MATLPGYIHPDEFFQNPEITSSKIFGIKTWTPWEYQPHHAARSIIAPFITTGIPFYILKSWIPKGSLPSSLTLFTTERLGSFLLSLVIDLCVYRLCKHLGTKPTIPVMLVATSQVTLAYTTHPFSNSFESILLCASLCTYADYAIKASGKLSFLLGTLFSLGIFTRITFPLYAFPIGIAYLYQVYKKSASIHHFTAFIFPFLLGLVSFAIFCIVADSVYYGTLKITVDDDKPFQDVNHVVSTLFNPVSLASIRTYGDIVITPLNNLVYNLNVDNLAQHGIHSRYTHFAINLPLLYGPLAIFGFLYIPNAFANIRNGDTNTHLFYVLSSVVFSGLIGLSIMPHQEARFLCPLLVPLVLIYTWKQPKLPLSFWTAWILFNVITTFVFGVAHQGGLIPTMGFLHRQTSGLHECRVLDSGDLTCVAGGNTTSTDYKITTNLVFYKTYMPPRHLLVIPKNHQNHRVNILDFSSRLDNVVHQLETSSGVILRRHQAGNPEIDFASTSIKNAYERTILITPSFVPLPKISHGRYLLMATYSPHLSFDDMDTMMERATETGSPESQMKLNIFLILSGQDT